MQYSCTIYATNSSYFLVSVNSPPSDCVYDYTQLKLLTKEVKMWSHKDIPDKYFYTTIIQ